MATKAERDLILDMLASGRIDALQARKLFDVVDRFSEDEDIFDPIPDEYTENIRKTIQHRLQLAERMQKVFVLKF